MTSPSSSTQACAEPPIFCNRNPSPPKMPAPSFFWNPTVSSIPSVAHRKPLRWIISSPPGCTWTGMICPGILVANATCPGAFVTPNSVMKMPPPPTARLSTPIMPLAPAVWVVVSISISEDIHDISPASETSFSPGFNVISSTGRTVPWICASMRCLLGRRIP